MNDMNENMDKRGNYTILTREWTGMNDMDKRMNDTYDYMRWMNERMNDLNGRNEQYKLENERHEWWICEMNRNKALAGSLVH